MGEILLRAENIDKHFGITHALDNVSFTFNKGEIHALIGENGSGKSTLTSCLTGIYQKDSGKFILEGKEITATNQVEANHQGVAIIVQEIGTLSGLTVAENIFLGNEDQFTKCGIKNTAAMNKKAQEYLDSYGFNYIDATKVIDDYNFEDRKLVEIVKSTYFNPKVLVVDETTTALGQKGREELFKVMHKVRDTGNCVIFISHDLEEVIEQSDNISVLRDGVKIGSITKEEATPDRLKALMVGREIGDSYYRTDYGEKVSDEVVLSAKNVTVKGQIENLNLDLHKGEILGIGGLSECGMHEVGKALFGASYFRQGSVTLGDGTPINSIPDAIKHSIAYASKDRDNESLVINDTIGDNICLPSLRKTIEDGHPGETEKLVREALKQHIPAGRIVEEAMTPAMRTVGENYKSNGADIIKILAAARSVRKGFELLEEQDSQFGRRNIGTVILGTVEGDLHDVGKNLVAIMFRSAGFKVIDLGVDISEKQFLRAVKQNPDVSIVCISSLLSTSIPEMEQVVKSLKRSSSKHKFKIMVGGGAVTEQLAKNMGADAYTENCIEAVEVAKTFIV